MKKILISYIFIVLTVFLSVLMIWPDTWVNLDIGSFHYHKEWVGPNLSDITLGLVDNDLDMKKGSDLLGTRDYKYRIQFKNDEPNENSVAKNTLMLIRNRIKNSSLDDASVNYNKIEGEYLIDARLPIIDGEKETSFSEIIFGRGKVELWVQKQEPSQQPSPGVDEDNPLRAFLSQQYDLIDANINSIKGYRTGINSEEAYLKLVLNQDASDQLTGEIFKFYSSRPLVLFDEQILQVDINDLVEQYQLYQEVRSVTLYGFENEKQAEIAGATIDYGPMNVSLEQVSVSENEPEITEGELVNSFLVLLAFLALFSIGLGFVLRAESLSFIVSLAIYILVYSAVVKLLPIRINMSTILAYLISIGMIISQIFKLVNDYKSKSNKAATIMNRIKNTAYQNRIRERILMFTLILGVGIITGPVVLREFSIVLVSGIVLNGIVLSFFITWIQNIINYYKVELE